MSVSLHGRTSLNDAFSDVVPLEKSLPQMCSTGAQRKGITLLDEEMSSLSKPLKRVADSGFQSSVRSEKTRKCFPMRASCFCGSSGTKNRSVLWQRAERQYLCVRCHSTRKDVLLDARSSSHVVATEMETGKKNNPYDKRRLQFCR